MKYLNIVKTSIVSPQLEPDWENEIPKRMRTRNPRIWRMVYAVVDRLLKDIDTKPKSLITATALGALDETKNYLDGVYKDGFGSPRSFIASVHNSMGGKIAIDFNIKGPNLTICDGQNSLASAIQTASLLTEDDYPVLLVAIDEKIELFDTITPYLSNSCKKYLNTEWEEAAIAFLLDSSSKNRKPYITATGPSLIYNQSPEEKCIKMVNTFSESNISLLPLFETSDSFIKPAIKTYEIINKIKKGNFAIGSFSPSAQAAAVVNICV